MINQFNSFPPNSKVWIYGANRKLSKSEIVEIQIVLDEFTAGWTAHQLSLKAKAAILDEHFIVIMVDENVATVSGCGIDKSVKLVQDITEKFGIDFFNRLIVYFESQNEVSLIPLSKISEAINQGQINMDTYVFNTLVQTKAELENNWKVKAKDSWLKGKLLGVK
jgi:hypothetical protein